MTIPKTDKKLRRLGPKRRNDIGLEIEELLRGEMKGVVYSYVGKHLHMAQSYLGMHREDLWQEVRMVMWRGLATYQPGRSSKKTYLTSLLKHRFSNLRRSTRPNSKEMPKLIPSETADDSPGAWAGESERYEYTEWLEYMEQFKRIIGELTPREKRVLYFYLKGKSIVKIMKSARLTKTQVVTSIHEIKRKMKEESIMRLKIYSNGINVNVTDAEGRPIENVERIRIEQNPGEVATATIVVQAPEIKFEGDTKVIRRSTPKPKQESKKPCKKPSVSKKRNRTTSR